MILVPTANAENVGIRPIISTIQCKKLIENFRPILRPCHVIGKRVRANFTEKLQSGDVFEAADVLKSSPF